MVSFLLAVVFPNIPEGKMVGAKNVAALADDVFLIKFLLCILFILLSFKFGVKKTQDCELI